MYLRLSIVVRTDLIWEINFFGFGFQFESLIGNLSEVQCSCMRERERKKIASKEKTNLRYQNQDDFERQ
jgi:hypothetical protein